MSVEKSSLEQQEQCIAVEHAGKERDAQGRFPRKWSVDLAVSISMLHKTRKEFRQKDSGAYRYLANKGLLHLISFETEVRVHRVDYFQVICEIKRCKTRTEFNERHPKSYAAVFNHQLLHDVYNSHFGRGATTKYWNKERAISSAKKHKTKNSLRLAEPGAYVYILNNNLSSVAFSHMTREKSDYDVVYLWVAEEKIDGKNLVKVGVTSKRLGKERVSSVSRKSGINVKRLLEINTDKALEIEGSIKRENESAGLSGFNGCSEFMIIGDQELDNIEKEYKWKSS